MKKLNLKKHVAIALAVLSANSSLSVFANGDGKNSPPLTAEETNSNARASDFPEDEVIDDKLRRCKESFYRKLEAQCIENGIEILPILEGEEQCYHSVSDVSEKIYRCIKDILDKKEPQPITQRVLEELETALRLYVPNYISNTIICFVRELFELANGLENSSPFIQRLFREYCSCTFERSTLSICKSVITEYRKNFMINEQKAFEIAPQIYRDKWEMLRTELRKARGKLGRTIANYNAIFAEKKDLLKKHNLCEHEYNMFMEEHNRSGEEFRRYRKENNVDYNEYVRFIISYRKGIMGTGVHDEIFLKAYKSSSKYWKFIDDHKIKPVEFYEIDKRERTALREFQEAKKEVESFLKILNLK